MASFVSGGGGGGSVQQHIFTGNCETAAATAAKVVTLDDSSGFSLAAGVRVAVTFKYGNSATTPTLNVSSSGAKNIVYNSSETAYTSGVGTTYNAWGAYETVIFTYTGSYWTHALSSWGVANTLGTDFMKKGVDYVTAGQKSGTTLGTGATTEGYQTTASGTYSHAEGYSTTSTNTGTHSEGVETSATGAYGSHAEGFSSSASGQVSHAEGWSSTASGNASHAEGGSVATGDFAHAEGNGTTASGDSSHAEGNETIASGDNSHTEGYNTTALRKSQHVFGENNILDTGGTNASTRGTYVEIVGNGTADDARSNARTLDWSGNEVLAGKLTVGAAPTNNMDVATKKYVDDAIPTVPAQVSKLYTATCPTAAATTAKVATLDDSTGFSLAAGVRVAVTFTYGNTATTPTLNVSSSGAKTIAIPSSATAFTTGSGTTYNTWGAYETVIFTYTGTYWTHDTSGRLGYLAYSGLSSKANSASPSLTGTPTAPTATAGTNSTQIATTAFVQTELGNKLTYGNTDLTAGTSTLAEGVFYAYYE